MVYLDTKSCIDNQAPQKLSKDGMRLTKVACHFKVSSSDKFNTAAIPLLPKQF